MSSSPSGPSADPGNARAPLQSGSGGVNAPNKQNIYNQTFALDAGPAQQQERNAAPHGVAVVAAAPSYHPRAGQQQQQEGNPPFRAESMSLKQNKLVGSAPPANNFVISGGNLGGTGGNGHASQGGTVDVTNDSDDSDCYVSVGKHGYSPNSAVNAAAAAHAAASAAASVSQTRPGQHHIHPAIAGAAAVQAPSSTSSWVHKAAPAPQPQQNKLDALKSTFPSTWSVTSRSNGRYRIQTDTGIIFNTIKNAKIYRDTGVVVDTRKKAGAEKRREQQQEQQQQYQHQEQQQQQQPCGNYAASYMDEPTEDFESRASNDDASYGTKASRLSAGSSVQVGAAIAISAAATCTAPMPLNFIKNLALYKDVVSASPREIMSKDLFSCSSKLLHYNQNVRTPVTPALSKSLISMFAKLAEYDLCADYSNPPYNFSYDLQSIYMSSLTRHVTLAGICKNLSKGVYKALEQVKIDLYRLLSNSIELQKKIKSEPVFPAITNHLANAANSLFYEHSLPSSSPHPQWDAKNLPFLQRDALRKNRLDCISHLFLSKVTATKLVDSLKCVVANEGHVDDLDIQSYKDQGRPLNNATPELLGDINSLVNHLEACSEQTNSITFDAVSKRLAAIKGRQPSIAPVLDRCLGMLSCLTYNFVTRGVDNMSATWAVPLKVVWVRENQKRPYYPGVVIRDMENSFNVEGQRIVGESFTSNEAFTRQIGITNMSR